MVANADVLVELVSEPTRRSILERLSLRPSSVTEIAGDMTITRSAVSQHLQLLKAAGLVDDRAEGTKRVYHVDPDALAVIREYFDAFWQRSLIAFQRHSEQANTSEEPSDHDR